MYARPGPDFRTKLEQTSKVLLGFEQQLTQSSPSRLRSSFPVVKFGVHADDLANLQTDMSLPASAEATDLVSCYTYQATQLSSQSSGCDSAGDSA